MYDLIVVGAGLHALTLLCALYEERPMDPNLIDAAGGVTRSKQSERTMRAELKRRRRGERDERKEKVLVVDRWGRWLENWKRQFEVLGIDALRSNASLHPDGFDPEMLFEYARMQGYSMGQAFEEITHVPRGKQFVGPFQVPKTAFFNAFCESLVDSFGLRDIVQQGEVTCLEGVTSGGQSEKGVRLWMKDGTFVMGRRVVVSIGHSNRSNVPDWVDHDLCCGPEQTLVHVWDLVHQDLSHLNLKSERVAVVGGGLTAVQLMQLAMRCGCLHVYLISRRPLTVRPFDSDLTWSGRLRHAKLQKFWNETDMEKRMDLIREARRGGTVTSSAHRSLTEMIADEKCTLLEGIEIWDAEWRGSSFHVELSNHESLEVERIWLATGSAIDVTQEPLFAKILQDYPVRVCHGYPVLDADLRWHPDLDVYFMGAYASLALGPDGVNLAGARRGAFRIRKQLRD